jgi:hypothetical protein
MTTDIIDKLETPFKLLTTYYGVVCAHCVTYGISGLDRTSNGTCYYYDNHVEEALKNGYIFLFFKSLKNNLDDIEVAKTVMAILDNNKLDSELMMSNIMNQWVPLIKVYI